MKVANKPKTAREVLDKYYQGPSAVLPVDVIGIANSYGIEVYRKRFGGSFKDSVYGLIRKKNGVVEIYVNSDNAPTRRKFTVAHELGHFFLHHNDQNELSYLDLRTTITNKTEADANNFAAELLMPEKELKEEHDKLMFPTVDALSKKFGVSKDAMRIRLHKLKLSAY